MIQVGDYPRKLLDHKGVVIKMKNKKEQEILTDLNRLLRGDLTSEERDILSAGREMLEKQVYFPKVINMLESRLTPLAVSRKLTTEVGAFYVKITSHEFKSKGLGIGTIMTGQLFF